MQLYAIALRALFAFVFMLIVVRISGHRTIKQGTPMDFVVALIVGDMFDDLFWAEVSAAKFVVGTGMLFTAHILVSMGAFSIPAIHRLVEGVPVPVLAEGKLHADAMRRERLNQQEVMSGLRQHGLDDTREVERATAESSGHISVLKRRWAKEAQQQDRPRLQVLLRKRAPQTAASAEASTTNETPVEEEEGELAREEVLV